MLVSQAFFNFSLNLFNYPKILVNLKTYQILITASLPTGLDSQRTIMAGPGFSIGSSPCPGPFDGQADWPPPSRLTGAPPGNLDELIYLLKTIYSIKCTNLAVSRYGMKVLKPTGLFNSCRFLI
jgi:hypothetical protein